MHFDKKSHAHRGKRLIRFRVGLRQTSHYWQVIIQLQQWIRHEIIAKWNVEIKIKWCNIAMKSSKCSAILLVKIIVYLTLYNHLNCSCTWDLVSPSVEISISCPLIERDNKYTYTSKIQSHYWTCNSIQVVSISFSHQKQLLESYL